MAESNRNTDTAGNQPEWRFDLIAWSRKLDVKSEEILAAMKELADTYQYASLRFAMATDFAEKVQELKSPGLGANRSPRLERRCREYSHDIEALLAELSKALSDIIRHS